MPRSHRPRKRYVPKRIDHDPVELAISGAALLHASQRASLIDPLRGAFEALRTGRGTQDAWRAMADALNVAEQLAMQGIASDHAELILRAQAALAALHARRQAGGSWTLRAPELDALRDAAEIHEIQLEHATQAETGRAITAARRRVQQALVGNAPRDAIVCIGALGTAPATGASATSGALGAPGAP